MQLTNFCATFTNQPCSRDHCTCLSRQRFAFWLQRRVYAGLRERPRTPVPGLGRRRRPAKCVPALRNCTRFGHVAKDENTGSRVPARAASQTLVRQQSTSCLWPSSEHCRSPTWKMKSSCMRLSIDPSFETTQRDKNRRRPTATATWRDQACRQLRRLARRGSETTRLKPRIASSAASSGGR